MACSSRMSSYIGRHVVVEGNSKNWKLLYRYFDLYILNKTGESGMYVSEWWGGEGRGGGKKRKDDEYTIEIECFGLFLSRASRPISNHVGWSVGWSVPLCFFYILGNFKGRTVWACPCPNVVVVNLNFICTSVRLSGVRRTMVQIDPRGVITPTNNHSTHHTPTLRLDLTLEG